MSIRPVQFLYLSRMFQYVVFVFFQTLIRIMPFGAMYAFSSFNALILQYIIRYRRKVIERNLASSFPELGAKELRKLKNRFYHYFTDMLFEAGKGYKMSRRNLDRRYVITNTGLMHEYFDQGRSVILLMAHFNNWEWITGTLGERFKHKVMAIYKPLRNKRIDAFIKKAREHRNFYVVPLANTGLAFRQITRQPCAYVMAADQSPLSSEKAYWVEFLHQETGFLHGSEVYARKFDLNVVFMKVMKKRRGFYEITLIPVSTNPTQMPEGHITAQYAALLEECIKKQPSRWLWSHKRWKRKKPDSKPLIKI